MYFIQRIAFFCLLITQGFSQSYHFKNYSAEQGLPFVQVYTMYQDSKGNLWIGGYGGLSKFDGKTFTNYSPNDGLVNHSVISITEDEKGNIWVGTTAGLSRFDGKSFYTYTQPDKLVNNRINSLITDKNRNIWMGTSSGIIVYNGETFTSITKENGLPSDNVSAIYLDKNNDMWACTDLGVSKIIFTDKSPTDQSFDNYSIVNGVYNKSVTSIAEDGSGTIWFGTTTGLVRYDAINNKKYTTEDGLPDNAIQSLVKDHFSNDIWVGTLKGISRIAFNRQKNNIENNTLQSFRVSDVQNGNKVGKLYTDFEGNIWLGTYNGLYRFRDFSFSTYSDKDGLKNPFIIPLFRDNKKKLWIGTLENGFYSYDGTEFKNITVKDGLLSNHICSGTKLKNGNLLFGSGKGLSIYDGKSFKNIAGRKDGLHGDSVTAVLEDKMGRVWIGGNAGVAIIHNGGIKKITLKSTVNNFDVWYLFEDSQGYIWIGTYLGGLFRYNPNDDKGVVEDAIEDMKKLFNLSSHTYLAINEDNEGNIYLGSFDGIYIYNKQSNKITSLTEKDGMSSDLVYVLGFDSTYHFLYIGTNQGLNKFDLKEYKKSGKKIFQHFGTEEGFSSHETNSSGIWRDEDGSFWFGTVNGLIHYNPSLNHQNHTETSTSITKIRLFYTDTLLENNARLSYDLNNISFEYIGICLTNPDKVRYKIMLEGLDKNWSPETQQTNARYSSLPPGNYTFKVIACNNEDIWNKVPTTFSFTILPPIWRTWWFILSVALIIIACTIILFRFRIEAIKKAEKVRLSYEIELVKNELKALRSQMDPHFIFNSLNSIQGLIMEKDEDAALKYLNKFAKLMRLILSNGEKSLISLREEIDALKLYLELEALRWDNKFEYEITIDPKIDIDDYKIPTMLIQPYVENAILHGVVPDVNKKGRIEIKMILSDNHIICKVNDNGIGIKRSKERNSISITPKHQSIGMKITGERLQAINRLHQSKLSVNIIDKRDRYPNSSGTEVEIFIPV